jgi:hypothetical protein
MRRVPEVRTDWLASSIASGFGLLTALALQLANIPVSTVFHGPAPYLAGVCWVLLTAGFTFHNLVMPVVRGNQAARQSLT